MDHPSYVLVKVLADLELVIFWPCPRLVVLEDFQTPTLVWNTPFLLFRAKIAVHMLILAADAFIQLYLRTTVGTVWTGTLIISSIPFDSYLSALYLRTLRKYLY
jgi:hypothetical protein